jgi:phage host-nuclease inhibitor protein Gam
MAREKKTIIRGVSPEAMEQAFGEYAAADARLEKIKATIDVQVTAIRERYADEMNRLSAVKEANFEVLQAYATEHKDELFVKKKSVESIHGTMGFRTGTPKLKTLKGFTWGAVTQLLKEFLPAYVRVSVEPAKDLLLINRDTEEVREVMPRVGITVVQDETFFVEPKKENGVQS